MFAINTDGSGFTTLHNFDSSSDGAGPNAGVILSGNTLFGTAQVGGNAGAGTVFAVNTEGTEFSAVHYFLEGSGGFHINDDGYAPEGRLSLSSNVLYGTTIYGGSAGQGVVFAVNTDGTGFLNLHTFPARSGFPSTNSDGANPRSGVILSGNTLYGTAMIGGRWAKGTVFAVNTDGTGFTNLHSFSATSSSPPYTNSDGAGPKRGLLLSGNTLYGTANAGGRWGNGTVFSLKPDGTGFTTLHSFAATSGPFPATNSQGANPQSELIMSGNTLYGTAFAGGLWGLGTVFSLSFQPKLTIIPSGTNVLLTWPTNYAGFDYTGYTLQSTTNLVPPAIWSTVSSPPIILNGQNTVTNPVSGIHRFYRLEWTP